jgi:tetratricopeptide (TPR) repeat protein
MTKTQHRIRKHEMKEDSFVTFAFRAQEYIQNHQRLMMGALGVLVLLVLGAWLLTSSNRKSETEGETLLGSAFARVQQNDMDGAATIYRQVQDEFGGTPAAREGSFYLANMQFVQQKWADAIATYEDYLKHYSSFDPGRNAAAHAAIGDACQSLSDHARALEHYDLALNVEGAHYLRSDIFLAAARSALALNKPDVAQAYADRLFENDGNSAVMTQMRELLALHGVRYLRGF